MTEDIEHEPAETLTDDSLAYEQAQAGLQIDDDPLAAIKALRLGQLAVCKLKSEQEMQAMRDELESDAADKDVPKQ